MSSKNYQPMKIEDGLIYQTFVDLAKKGDQTAVQIFKVKHVRKHWWWPFKSKKDKEFELVVTSLINQKETREQIEKRFMDMHLYGRFDPSEEDKANG